MSTAVLPSPTFCDCSYCISESNPLTVPNNHVWKGKDVREMESEFASEYLFLVDFGKRKNGKEKMCRKNSISETQYTSFLLLLEVAGNAKKPTAYRR
ncbi:hypothetical protein L2E82_25592 [Cichorium intybus]|uniref:Uncharacterized protein n=1 Tax=Cichorium intybus TaxID=13427 RepID=A0ACB9E4Z1_CICIN|nr:hypothetical protein L2E82_25592 [Cichorium intybus]